jgi:hypothetical protein
MQVLHEESQVRHSCLPVSYVHWLDAKHAVEHTPLYVLDVDSILSEPGHMKHMDKLEEPKYVTLEEEVVLYADRHEKACRVNRLLLYPAGSMEMYTVLVAAPGESGKLEPKNRVNFL